MFQVEKRDGTIAEFQIEKDYRCDWKSIRRKRYAVQR